MDLDKECTDVNHGGLLLVEYVPIEDVESIPDPSVEEGVIESAITLKAGKTWYSARVTPDTFDYNESRSENPQGEMYQKELTGFFGMDTPVVRRVLSQMNRRKFILRCKDSNGFIRVLGSFEYPYVFTSKLAKNKDFAQPTGHSLVFKSVSPIMERFLVV